MSITLDLGSAEQTASTAATSMPSVSSRLLQRMPRCRGQDLRVVAGIGLANRNDTGWDAASRPLPGAGTVCPAAAALAVAERTGALAEALFFRLHHKLIMC
ncbi:hypothetical protein ACFV1W_31550 [Kitasatospora sp. NPDC059648]|uniref:hypothetical protein n=1 Tax=Kitasatospora sp. NPDC059648 TaxID=3346894 RepID=UPI0036C6A873